MTINLKVKKSATCVVDIQNIGEHVESIVLVNLLPYNHTQDL